MNSKSSTDTEATEISTPLLLLRSNDHGGGNSCSSSSTYVTVPVAPPTTILILSTLVAVFGSYVFGSALGYSSPAQYGIMHDLNITVAQYSLFGSLLSIGAMIGAMASGSIADYAGRRLAMGFSAICCIMGWLVMSFSKVVLWLYVGRLLVGCGMGLLSYVVPVYVAEITPKNLRGGFTATLQLMVCFGLSLSYLIGEHFNWRILALIGTIPSVAQLLSLSFIPESPRWLAKVGCFQRCESALQRLRGKNADVSQEATEIREFTESLEKLPKASIIGLFQLQYLKSLTVGVGIMSLQQLGGVNGFVFYATSIFVSAGFSKSIGSIAMVTVKIPMTILGVFLVDRSGRRPLLLISASGTCLGCFLAAVSFLLQDLDLDLHKWKEVSPILALVGVLAMGFSTLCCILGWLSIAFSKVAWWLYVGRLLVGFGMGLLSYVVPIYVAEITPKNLRGGFTSLHQLMICFGVSLTYLIGAYFNWRLVALIGTIPCLAQLFSLAFIPESPRWLAKVGCWERSESALQRLRGKNADVSQEATEIRDFTEALQQQTESSMIGLFQFQYLNSLAVGVGLLILQQFSGVNGIVFYANSIFVSAGFSRSIGTIAMVAIQIPMTGLGVILMDKSGRRPLLLISATGTCLGCFLATLSFFLQDLHKWKEVSPIMALVGVLVMILQLAAMQC